MLNAKEIEALEVFVAYFTIYEPYKDMRKIDYLLLHEYFQRLPPQVFTKPKVKYLWHVSKDSAKIDTLRTESGIVSCTTPIGIDRVIRTLNIQQNDCKFKIYPPARVISASELLKVAQASGIIVYGDIIARARFEHEHVVLLEGLKSQLTGRFCQDKKRFVNCNV